MLRRPALLTSIALLVFSGAVSAVDLTVPSGTTLTKNTAGSYGQLMVAGRLIVQEGAALTFSAESHLDGVETSGIRPEIIINGGSVYVGNRTNMGTDKVGNGGNYAYLTMNGGTLTVTDTFKFPDDSGGEHRIYLNGGVMHCHDIEQKHERDAIMYVGGGILRLDVITGGDRDPHGWKSNGDLLPADGYDDVVIEDLGSYTEVRGVRHPSTVQFETSSSGALESVSLATLVVNLSEAQSETVTVDYAVTGGTAEGGGVDYAIEPSPLVFDPCQVSKTIDILVTNDGFGEEDETIEVTLTGVSGGEVILGETVEHTYTIFDPRPKVSFSSGFSSGRESVTPAYIEVGLSWATDETVTVDYAATGGTAEGNGVDYTLLGGGTLTFDPCETVEYISLAVVDDACEEEPETIELELSNPTPNARFGDYNEHTFTIVEGAARLRGAYYCRLDSGQPWESTARVSSHADIRVRLGDANDQLVFWRASSYLPYWQTDAGSWYFDEVVPRSGDGGGIMPDTINQHSRVMVIESSAARAVVHWRYVPDFSNVTPDGWVDEYFTVYPDGVCIRTINIAEGTTLAQWQDPCNITIEKLRLEYEGVGPLPTSWQNPAALSISSGSYSYEGFDETRRCYTLQCDVTCAPTALSVTLDTSGGKSNHNPVIVLKNWGDAEAQVSVDGGPFSDCYVGYADDMYGDDLVVWLGIETPNSIDVSITPSGGSGEFIGRADPCDFGYDFESDVPPLPMGSPEPGPFGAYYTHLEFNNRFDDYWRVGEHADVVVQFDDNEHRFVFWRGTNYGPHWASDTSETYHSNWYGTQFVERRASEWGGDGCCAEPMQDWDCRYAHVRIISSNAARAIVQWRYASCDKNYDIVRDGPGDVWGDWDEEYFTIYPDAISVRKVTAYSSRTGGVDMESPHIEYHEAIPVTNPGTIPEDNIHWNALSATDYAGNKRDWIAQDIDGGAMTDLHLIANKPIMVVRMKGSTVPVSIVEGTSVEHDPVGQHDCRPFNAYDDWPAWPMDDRSMGGPLWDEDPSTHCYRFFWTKYPSHCSILHLKWMDYEHVVDVRRTKVMLFGMVDAGEAANVNNLIPLARSWQYAPSLNITSTGFSGGSYDKTERAYKIIRTSPAALMLDLTLQGSASSPIVNPCFVIENWWRDSDAKLTIDGVPVSPGPDFRRGIEESDDGISSLVVWMRKESTVPVEVTITKEFDLEVLGGFCERWLEDCAVGQWCDGWDVDHSERVDFTDFAVFTSQ